MVHDRVWRPILATFLIFSLLAIAGTIVTAAPTATCNVPTGSFPTIQSAVNEPSCSSIVIGAGIFTEAVTITRSVIVQGQGVGQTIVKGDGNHSVFDISGPIAVTVEQMTIRDGRGSSGGGLAIIDATVRATDLRLTENATSNGAAVYVQNGSLDLIRVTLDSNTAFLAGGALYINGGLVNLQEGDLAFNEVSGGDGGAIYNSGGAITIQDSSLSENKATLGGSIYNQGDLVVSHSTFVRNEGNNGGAIMTYGSTYLSYSTLARNTATFGGAITSVGDLTVTFSTLRDNEAGEAGAIGSGAALTLTHSMLSNNTATTGNGGALLTGIPARAPAAAGAAGAIIVLNTTVASNTAAGNGGAFYHGNPSQPATIDSSTFASNSATTGGGLFNSDSSTVDLRNTIVANNTNADCVGTITSLGFNLDGDGSCNLVAMGDQPSANPLLAPLARNGGPTDTLALLHGSPAIDQGDPLHCLEDDQRGFMRPQDGDEFNGPACDIGAFEHIIFDWAVLLPAFITE